MYKYISICVWMSTLAYVSMHTYICTYVGACVHPFTLMHAHTCAYMCISILMNTHPTYTMLIIWPVP